jgi:hypothetical protein
VVATGAGFVKEGERVRVAGPDTMPGTPPEAAPAGPQGGRGAQRSPDAQGIEGVRA